MCEKLTVFFYPHFQKGGQTGSNRMEKAKTLEQLRAEKERAETQACTGTAQAGASGEPKEVSGTGRTSRSFSRNEKRSRSPAGPRRLGTATRISASLSRRLSASFWRTPGQDPKAAKFAVLIPGHAGFPNRVKRSEGSDTTPIRNARVSACEPLCAIFLREPSVCPLSLVKANVGRLCKKLKNTMKSGWG